MANLEKHVYDNIIETIFWRPSHQGDILSAKRAQSDEEEIDEFPKLPL